MSTMKNEFMMKAFYKMAGDFFKPKLLSPYRHDEAFLLEVLNQWHSILFEVGEASLGGFGVIVGSSLLLRSLLQTLL